MIDEAHRHRAGQDQEAFGYKDRIKTEMTTEELTQALQLADQLWQDTQRPTFAENDGLARFSGS